MGNQSALLTAEGHFAHQLGHVFLIPQLPCLPAKKFAYYAFCFFFSILFTLSFLVCSVFWGFFANTIF